LPVGKQHPARGPLCAHDVWMRCPALSITAIPLRPKCVVPVLGGFRDYAENFGCGSLCTAGSRERLRDGLNSSPHADQRVTTQHPAERVRYQDLFLRHFFTDYLLKSNAYSTRFLLDMPPHIPLDWGWGRVATSLLAVRAYGPYADDTA